MSAKSKAAAAEAKKPLTLNSENVPLSYRIKKDLQRNGLIYAMLIPVLVYYAVYNGFYLIPEAIICIVLAMIPQIRRLAKQLALSK